MNNLDNALIHADATIRDALSIIDKGGIKIAMVTKEDQTFIGTISDGDIRRGLLRGMTLNSPIESIISKNPITYTKNDSKRKIINQAIKKSLYHIPILDEHDRLIDVEDLSSFLKPKCHSNPVVLMAGGLGTRLRPLTESTPKPMLHVGDQPILQTIIKNFVKHNFSNIIVSVNYKAEAIISYFQDGDYCNANISYVHETKRMGTAGALSLMRKKLTKPFFVMNADLLTTVDPEKLLQYHEEQKASATMCVREYDLQVPYGVIELQGNEITNIIEKPIHKFYVNAGIYVLSPNVLELIPEDTFYDMPTLFEELIKLNKKTCSFPIHEYWLDIGRLRDFEKANKEYYEIFT